MSKKIDWDANYTDPIRRKMGSSKYSSGKDLLSKAFAAEQAQKSVIVNLDKAMPLAEKLLAMRIHNKTPLKVMRPLHYRSSELQKGSSQFVDVTKSIYPGVDLHIKMVDYPMQELVFSASNGEEIAINFADSKQILLNTDIYETVMQVIDNQ